jgi:hypothetical protein
MRLTSANSPLEDLLLLTKRIGSQLYCTSRQRTLQLAWDLNTYLQCVHLLTHTAGVLSSKLLLREATITMVPACTITIPVPCWWV